jgi:alpha-tubulin suppressor-like RCC1 family protein
MSWGGNCSGQLGNGVVATDLPGVQPLPGAVVGISGVSAVVAGSAQSFALKSVGTVWGWGNNTWGQLGIGGLGFYPTPTVIPGFGDGM